MKYRVDTLEGALLDAAVAKAEGMFFQLIERRGRTTCEATHIEKGDDIAPSEYALLFSPSCDWAAGGPIIEREQIAVAYHPLVEQWAACGNGHRWLGLMNATGPTPLIAAMRAYVASRFGDEVDL